MSDVQTRTREFLAVPIDELQDLLIPKGYRLGIIDMETEPGSCRFCGTPEHHMHAVHQPVLCRYCLTPMCDDRKYMPSPICSDRKLCPICCSNMVNQVEHNKTRLPDLCDYVDCCNVAVTKSGRRKRYKCVHHIISTNELGSTHGATRLRNEEAVLFTLARLYVHGTIQRNPGFYGSFTWVADLPMFEQQHHYFSNIRWEPELLASFEHSRKEKLHQFFLNNLPTSTQE